MNPGRFPRSDGPFNIKNLTRHSRQALSKDGRKRTEAVALSRRER